MQYRKLEIFFSVLVIVLVGLSVLAPQSGRTASKSASTIVCEDESIAKGITWSVKIEVRAVRNDTGEEFPRDPSADISDWKLACIKHAATGHHKGDKVHTGVCLAGDACQTQEAGKATVLTPGPYHCHVINGDVICHEY